MNNRTLFLSAALLLLTGYYLWSFFVNSRYQALCNVTYLDASKDQIAACKDLKSELDGQR